MAKVQVFDPPMCCPTGVCGPAVDPVLPRFAADLGWLKEQGVSVERYNLSQEPTVFAANATVRGALQDRGEGVLPLVLVDDRIVAEGAYPARETLAALAGIVIKPAAKLTVMKVEEDSACCSDDEEGCCGGDDAEAKSGGCDPKSGCC